VLFIGRSNDGLVMRRLPTGNWLELSPDLAPGFSPGSSSKPLEPPMLVGDNIAGLRPESAANLAAPRAYSEALDCKPAFWIGAMYFQLS
jgi:hypothetical protein